MKKRTFLRILAAAALLVMLVGCGNSSGNNQPDPVINSSGATTLPTGTTAYPLDILLLGDSEITLEFGTEFVDPGVRVEQNGLAVPAAVAVEVPQWTQPGTYTVTYRAELEGLTAEACLTVVVVDTQAPVITLTADPNHYTPVGTEYQEEGYTALDNCDGDLTEQVVRTQEGDRICYSVTDSSGNTATVWRDVVYGDSVAPELTLLGDSEVEIMAGDGYSDPGCTAWDNADGDLTDSIQISGGYEKYLPGTYYLHYSITDSFGNTSEVSRKITVKGYVQPETVYPEGKVIYLTFDDGPCGYTLDLLEVLEKYNVKATFFVVGSKKMDYLDEIAEGGHAIGIHSNTHNYGEIYVSEEAFFEDFFAVRQKIYDRTGIWTTLCRFPGGSSNTVSRKYCEGIMTKLTQAVEAQGFQYFDWNVNSSDAGGTTSTDQVFKNVVNGIKGKDYAVVLQHDIKSYSVAAVEEIIQWGLANGYTFLPLDATSPTCHHSVNN